MTITVANTANTNTVGYFRTRVNEIAAALTGKVVTVNSNTAVGNASITGSLEVNTTSTYVLTGGNNTTAANLSVTSNVIFSGSRTTLGLGANVSITTGNSTARVLTVNSAGNYTLTALKINTSDLSDLAIVSPATGDVLLYDNATSTWKNSQGSLTFQIITQKNVANGYPGLNSNGFITNSQLNGVMIPQGNWDSNTNTPTLSAANSLNKGYYYYVTVAGTTNLNSGGNSINVWSVGDQFWSDGTLWRKVAGAAGTYLKGNQGTIGQASDAGNIFRITGNTLTTSVTLAAGENSVVAGPLTVNTGITLTIQTGARLVIV